jgi:predicted nucleic acid-binding protein
MTNSRICIDANLVVWTLVPAPFSAGAEVLLAQWRRAQTALIAPALLAFEVTATLRRLVYLKHLTEEEGDAAFARFQRIPVRLSQRQALYPLAWELSKRFNRPRAYDTAYLALAQLHHCDFWTADAKLYNAVRDTLPWVHWVGNLPSPGNGHSSP